MQTLMTLYGQAESERDAAQARLREAEQAAARHAAQATQLADYRSETQRRWTTQFSQQGAIEILHCYRSFMDRLDQASQQQQRSCDLASGQVERARAELAQAEMRVASVRKLIERRVEELRQHEQRLDQKRNDEAGQRSALDRRRNAVPGATLY